MPFDLLGNTELGAFVQVVLIDLVLAGDNAVVIGLAAAGLAPEMRRKAIIFGILAATVMRIALAIVTTQLLAIVGLVLAGGILLLWVCWKMWVELHHSAKADRAAAEAIEDVGEVVLSDETPVSQPDPTVPRKTLGAALIQIMVADLSMSLDNVLAVAGAAREHPTALAFGLVLSVALMGFAAAFIARLLNRHRWIAYVGLAVILVVALRMIFEGAEELHGPVASLLGAH